MAISIIRAGKRRETAQTTCRNCYSVLSFNQSDVKRLEQYQHEESYIRCPVCGTRINVDMTKEFGWIDPATYHTDN